LLFAVKDKVLSVLAGQSSLKIGAQVTNDGYSQVKEARELRDFFERWIFELDDDASVPQLQQKIYSELRRWSAPFEIDKEFQKRQRKDLE
jgi:hypothetical protein